MIMAGEVRVNSQPANKAGMIVPESADIILNRKPHPYVSRGGLKLEKALLEFALDCRGLCCMDVGASTGGFTDCLLQHGAARVYAVDVGYGQLAWKLRTDDRVIVLERTNIRYLDALCIPEKMVLITIDTAFISLKQVVPASLPFLKGDGALVVLIKPQFEVGRGQVGKRGVVRDARAHERVITDLSDFFKSLALTPSPAIESPLRGPQGNREFLMYLRRS